MTRIDGDEEGADNHGYTDLKRTIDAPQRTPKLGGLETAAPCIFNRMTNKMRQHRISASRRRPRHHWEALSRGELWKRPPQWRDCRHFECDAEAFDLCSTAPESYA